MDNLSVDDLGVLCGSHALLEPVGMTSVFEGLIWSVDDDEDGSFEIVLRFTKCVISSLEVSDLE